MVKEKNEFLKKKLICFFVENSMNFSLYFSKIQKSHLRIIFFLKKQVLSFYLSGIVGKKIKSSSNKHFFLKNLKILRNLFFFNLKKKMAVLGSNKWCELLWKTTPKPQNPK